MVMRRTMEETAYLALGFVTCRGRGTLLQERQIDRCASVLATMNDLQSLFLPSMSKE